MQSITRTDIISRVDRAGAILRSIVTEEPPKPEQIIYAADQCDLPVGFEVEKDPIARTICIAAFACDARAPLEAGYEAVCKRMQAFAQAIA